MSTSSFHTLAEWLAWMEQQHPEAIALGLERIRPVAERLDLDTLPLTITVAGTNGKGSVVALLESILLAAGYRTGVYTSPHLLQYNERVRLDGRTASDELLCRSFADVERVRNGVPLTYFEFGTLGALALFSRQQPAPDVLVLEVGLGGRLDAVNIVDPDIAVVTSIALDHTEWLGQDRNSIAREKAGIFRAQRPVVCGDRTPPPALLETAQALDCPCYLLGRDFDGERRDDHWRWWQADLSLDALSLPGLHGPVQIDNAAVVLKVLALLGEKLPLTIDDINRGLREVSLAGRFQVIHGEVEEILDVCHNPAAAEALARALSATPGRGKTRVVLAMLSDKDAAGVVTALEPVVDSWYVAGLATARGQSGEALAARLRDAGTCHPIHVHADVGTARRAAHADAVTGDRILVCGSFLTVAEALQQTI